MRQRANLTLDLRLKPLDSLMPLNVLIIPDKFKGTLTARAAAEAIARGWREARAGDSLSLLPMSDGGDGFGEVTSALLKAKIQHVRAVDAAHRPCSARWWWEPRTRTAVIESAAVIGLAMLPPRQDCATPPGPRAVPARSAQKDLQVLHAPEDSGVGGAAASWDGSRSGIAHDTGLPPQGFHPFQLDTFGLGAVVRAAARRGARRCLMGIGGSATNDGGFGLACALGWEFLDREGEPIGQWTELGRLARIRAPQHRRWFNHIVVATDVRNRLLGRRGATRVYGPQKGLRPQDFSLADRCVGRLARVVKKQFGHDFAREPGAGAAGGLGFGLLAFLGGELQPGFDLFARQAALERHLGAADLVVTGEGAIDCSTLMGKGVGQIAQRCRQLNIPCIGLAGMVSANLEGGALFTQAYGLTELTTVTQAKVRPAYWLERLARMAAAQKSEDRRPKAERRPKTEIRE
jgi:glycerate kinase